MQKTHIIFLIVGSVPVSPYQSRLVDSVVSLAPMTPTVLALLLQDSLDSVLTSGCGTLHLILAVVR